MLMAKSEKLTGECHIGIQLLADKCRDQSVGSSGTDVWVSNNRNILTKIQLL